MKVFISSVVTGMEEFRNAAREAVTQLGHDPVMAEDFHAKPHSPKIACLDGLRQSGLVVLILGSEYGPKQKKGISATHEEYREAKESHPILAFVQKGVSRNSDQAAFLEEVQSWEGGLFRTGFDTPESLKAAITRAIHQWEVSNATAPLDANNLRNQAVKAVFSEQNHRYYSQPSLVLSVIGGPPQPVLRPSEIENPQLARDLLQEALFGSYPIFDHRFGNQTRIENNNLVMNQENRERVIKLVPQGGLIFNLNLDHQSLMVIIQEKLKQEIFNAFKYAGMVFEKIDPTQRLTHVAFAAGFTGSEYITIRTQAEHYANPNSVTIGIGQADTRPVHLIPAHRSRGSFNHETEKLVEDLIVLLRRATTRK
jgi:hypothetical protein